MTAALFFLLGLAVGLLFGSIIQWAADLPREYRR